MMGIIRFFLRKPARERGEKGTKRFLQPHLLQLIAMPSCQEHQMEEQNYWVLTARENTWAALGLSQGQEPGGSLRERSTAFLALSC